MRHHCTACLHEFFDETGGLPDSDSVHCVSCGSKIPLRRRTAGTPISAVPFSKEVEREETFALGVINATGAAFPDTLRQFRVRPPAPRPDSLAPVAGNHEISSEEPRAPWRLGSFWVSLAVGLAGGVALASSFTASRPQAQRLAEPLAAPSPVPQAPVSTSSQPVAAALPPPTATCAAIASEPPKSVPARPPSPAMERRWLLDRARTQQREYRLAEAERLYRQVLLRAPRDSEALAGLGELELLRGTADLADAHFRRALEANEDYIPALIAVADIRFQAGQVDEARQAYRRIVDSYSADLYPPYVAQRSQGIMALPCDAPVGAPDEP